MPASERQVARLLRHALQAVLLSLGLSASFGLSAQAMPGVSNEQIIPTAGPVRLSQPLQTQSRDRTATDGKSAKGDRALGDRSAEAQRDVYKPSEFEQFVRQLAGLTRVKNDPLGEEEQTIRRFGVEMLAPKTEGREDGADATSLVPDDYMLGPGDELVLNLWGSVEANLRLTVDRSGRVSIPRVGTVSLAGVRYADLRSTIARRVASQFRNFELSVGLGQVRAVRVYVTGFVQRPGAQAVNGLSTMLHALMAAGGPTAVGSFRSIQLRRNGAVISTLDLYDLLLRGDRSADRVLRSEDVIHVNAVGAQVGVIGSVNKPAVFELKPGETVADALAMAGGLSAVANRSAAVIHRLDERAGQALRDVKLAEAPAQPMANGDVLRVLSVADMARPALRQAKRVRVEGEVQKPGDYVLPANSSLGDAIKAAGGLTAEAYLFGAEFSRESVRLSQMENYDRTLRELESEYNRAAVTRKEKVAPPTDAASAQNIAQIRLIERLRAVQPTGRVVLQMRPEDANLPELALEDGDRLHIPARPSTVNVYGSVFNSGSYLFVAGRALDQYIGLAGGLTRGSDSGSVFVLRANGSVVSNRSVRASWSLAGGVVESLQALPGDTVFVPEELNKLSMTQELKDWAQILSQFGLGAVALKNLNN